MIQFALKISGVAAVAVGVLAIAFGSFWASQTMEFLSSSSIGGAFETFVPFLRSCSSHSVRSYWSSPGTSVVEPITGCQRFPLQAIMRVPQAKKPDQ